MVDNMPKHIASGLKYLAAVKLKERDYTQKEIANILDIDRSTVSHYLNGRNLSWNSIDVANTIVNMCPKDFLAMVQILFKNLNMIRTISLILKSKDYDAVIKDSCIGCGLCVDLCVMKAIKLDSLKAKIQKDYCIGCLTCEEECPTRSIRILEVNK